MRLLTFILVCSFLLAGCDEDSTGTRLAEEKITAIWQGTYHDWTYNHRVNRMGDWIDDALFENGAFSAKLRHSAASGIGADRNSYKSFITFVRTTSDVEFYYGKTTIILQGEEGSISGDRIRVTVPIEGPERVVRLLTINGFDMYSRPGVSMDLLGDGQADKLFHFRVAFESVSIAETSDGWEASFSMDVSLGANCTSPECSSGPVNDFFDYEVTIAWQLILGDLGDLVSTFSLLENSYEWERPLGDRTNYIKREDFRLKDQQIQGQPGFEAGTVGLRYINFNVEKGLGGFDGTDLEHPHMQYFDMALFDQSYDPATGSISFDADLFFRNWSPPIPPVSFGGGGSLDFEIGAILIQFKEGSSETVEYGGEILWLTNPLNPSPPNIGAAINTIGVGRN